MTTAIKGARAFARQEARFREVAGFARYFRDERGMTREQVHGILDQMLDVVDGYRLFTDLDGNPLASHGVRQKGFDAA